MFQVGDRVVENATWRVGTVMSVRGDGVLIVWDAKPGEVPQREVLRGVGGAA